MQVGAKRNDNAPRRPAIKSLYDVISNIRDDEGAHVETMRACQDGSIIEALAAEAARNKRV